jgi:serine protease AprX
MMRRRRGLAVLVPLAATLVAAAAPAHASSTAPRAAAALADDYSFDATAATMADVRRIIRADVANQQGYTGKGVGVALIDTGVAPVPGLTSGNIVNGPDLSLESQVANLAHRDTYGHGTHMAGIIAGRDNTSGTGFRGIAPDAKLTSIKVGMANGAVDITQVLAAIDWVVAHRNDDPANPIRIINLSYGTDSTLPNAANALSAAVQNARRAGILVVVAAGNTGNAMTSPAYDPFVLTVGGTDPYGTTYYGDDVIADFSSRTGIEGRSVDLYAPGRSIVSLRDPGAYVDVTYPTARVGDRFFKGSGTSQAAAVVTGAAAVYLQKWSNDTPDQIKCNLYHQSRPVPGAPWGQVDLSYALEGAWTCGISAPEATGSGGFQGTRGTCVVTINGASLTGERDIFGPLSASAWAAASKAGTAWSGGNWMGRPWTGTGWTTATYGQANWSGRAWSGRAWSGRAWSDLAWAGATWTGRAWSSSSFSGQTWAGATWKGAAWLSGNGKWMP